MAFWGGNRGKTRGGLFIFGGTMQYIVLSRQSGDAYRVEECVDVPYSTGTARGDIFADPEIIARNLKTLKKKIKNWDGDVYAGIQSKDVLLRTVELPRMDMEDIKKSFRFEFGNFFPIPVDEAIYDVALVEKPKDGGKASDNVTPCLVAAVKISVVENLMMAAHDAGLKLSGIEPSPVAMLRCLMGPEPPAGFNVYALAGLVSSVIIAAYRDNGIVFRNTTQAFAKDDPSGENASDFTRDLLSTVKFAATQIRDFYPDAIYIGGYGLAANPSLKDRVEEVTDRPVVTVNPWELWEIKDGPERTYGWETALGLALGPMEV